MFQYATARALALKHQTDLLADSRSFRTYRLHSYSIDRFNTQMVEADESSLNGFVLPPEKRGLLSVPWWHLKNRGRLKLLEIMCLIPSRVIMNTSKMEVVYFPHCRSRLLG